MARTKTAGYTHYWTYQQRTPGVPPSMMMPDKLVRLWKDTHKRAEKGLKLAEKWVTNGKKPGYDEGDATPISSFERTYFGRGQPQWDNFVDGIDALYDALEKDGKKRLAGTVDKLEDAVKKKLKSLERISSAFYNQAHGYKGYDPVKAAKNSVRWYMGALKLLEMLLKVNVALQKASRPVTATDYGFADDEWAKVVGAAAKIIRNGETEGIALAGGMGSGKPEVGRKGIVFNGSDALKEMYETFGLYQHPESPDRTWAFCKTELKPYDAVVVSVLAAARQIAPNAISVSSDGGASAIKRIFAFRNDLLRVAKECEPCRENVLYILGEAHKATGVKVGSSSPELDLVLYQDALRLAKGCKACRPHLTPVLVEHKHIAAGRTQHSKGIDRLSDKALKALFREKIDHDNEMGKWNRGGPLWGGPTPADWKAFQDEMDTRGVKWRKAAAKWEGPLPKGWTDESRKKFWESLTSAAPKHKVTQCIKKMEDSGMKDPGAFCASLADREIPGWRQEAAKERAKKKAATNLRQVKSLMKKYNVPGEVKGRGANWEVELPDEKAKRLFEKTVEKVIGPVGGFRSGYGSWVLRPGYEGAGDWNDQSSRHHYAGLNQTAKTILEQMGGMRAMKMIGATQVIGLSKGLGIKWPNKQRSKGNYVEILLTPADLYDMTFYNVSRSGKKKVKEHRGIFWDQLGDLFEKQTGWYLRMGSTVSASFADDAAKAIKHNETIAKAKKKGQHMGPRDVKQHNRVDHPEGTMSHFVLKGMEGADYKELEKTLRKSLAKHLRKGSQLDINRRTGIVHLTVPEGTKWGTSEHFSVLRAVTDALIDMNTTEWAERRFTSKENPMDLQLRRDLLRVAKEDPSYRKAIIPVLLAHSKVAGCEKLPEGPMRDNCEKKKKDGGPPGKKDDKAEAKGDKKDNGDDKKDDKKKDDGKMPADLLEKFKAKKAAELKIASKPYLEREGLNAATLRQGGGAMMYFIDPAAGSKGSSKFYEILVAEQPNGMYNVVRRWGALTDRGAGGGRVDGAKWDEDPRFSNLDHRKAMRVMDGIKKKKVGKGYVDAVGPLHVDPATGKKLKKGEYPVGLLREGPGFGWGTQEMVYCVPALRDLQESIGNAVAAGLDDDIMGISAALNNALLLVKSIPDSSMAGKLRKYITTPFNRLTRGGDPAKVVKELKTIERYIQKQLALCQ